MRLRIGLLDRFAADRCAARLRHLTTSAPTVHVDLETGMAIRLIDDLRAHRLDVVATALPAPHTPRRAEPGAAHPRSPRA